MTQELASALWRENADLAAAALQHQFVRGLADGSLPLQAFQRYVAQDAYFLDAYARAYALALAHSPDRDAVEAFFRLLAGAMEELRLHAGYAVRWGVHLQDVTPGDATLAYTEFLLSTAALGGVGPACAAMTPCMRLYAHLGQSLAAERAGQRQGASVAPYGEWIATYADPQFEALAATLESLLDRYATDSPAVRAAYRRAMRLEVAFFDAHAPVAGQESDEPAAHDENDERGGVEHGSGRD
jgi:thiaminase/transcriptional activator TenA